MAKMGWELVSVSQLINENSETIPQIMIFWGREDEN
jgi:hypothetical protein